MKSDLAELGFMERTKKGSSEQEEDLAYGASNELVDQIKSDLGVGNLGLVRDRIRELPPADVADLISRLRGEEQRAFLRTVQPVIDPEVLTRLDSSFRENMIETIGTYGLAKLIPRLNSNDALDVISNLDENQRRAVLGAIPEEERTFLEEILIYPEDSAGRLMQRKIVTVPPLLTISEVIRLIRSGAGIPDVFYAIYVVDSSSRPIGEVTVSSLLRYGEETVIQDIMNKTVIPVSVSTDKEVVASLFHHYALVSTPVVDELGQVVGTITVDDVVIVIAEEAEEDILSLSKVDDSDFHAPVIRTAYGRIRWLIIAFISTLVASYVISVFEVSIQEMAVLSFLMTINAAMGGNSGMQIVAVVVRVLATHNLKKGDIMKALTKELCVGLMTGGFFSIILGTIAILWIRDAYLGSILSLALLFNMLWASFAGTMLPIVISRLKLDPAVSAGPILTTTTDVFGYFVFLWLATKLLLTP